MATTTGDYMSDEIDRDTHDHDLTYENEQSTVTIPLKEYDKLKQQDQYITDPSLISIIDKIDELTRALRKHIVIASFFVLGTWKLKEELENED